ncbi:hypothetical protein [Aquisalibacillus elongatus]|nr:hypothetical protein [Aquisalibacillus elongatus]
MAKIHPLILLSLFFSTITLWMYVQRSISDSSYGHATIFFILSTFFLGLCIGGLLHNNRITKQEKSKDCSGENDS